VVARPAQDLGCRLGHGRLGDLQCHGLDEIAQSFDLRARAIQLIVAEHRREEYQRRPLAIVLGFCHLLGRQGF